MRNIHCCSYSSLCTGLFVELFAGLLAIASAQEAPRNEIHPDNPDAPATILDGRSDYGERRGPPRDGIRHGPRSEGGANDRPAPDAMTIQKRHVRKFAGELREMFDTDHDGAFSSGEAERMRSEMAEAERLERFILPWRVVREIDEDGDLEISDAELGLIPAATEKVRVEYEARRTQRATNPAMQNGGGRRAGREDRPKGQDGVKLWADFDKIRPEGLAPIVAEMKASFDENHDGGLDAAERTRLDSRMAQAEELQRYILPWKVVREVDGDGDMVISDEEVEAIPAAMFKFQSEFNAGRGPRRDRTPVP